MQRVTQSQRYLASILRISMKETIFIEDEIPDQIFCNGKSAGAELSMERCRKTEELEELSKV